MRRTKILATVGPASDSPGRLVALIEAGVDGFRLNLSHGTPSEHRSMLRRIHAAAERAGQEVSVVADVPGPKIRIGDLAISPITLRTGQRWVLDHDPRPGDGTRVRAELPSFSRAARRGDPVLLGDGNVALVVRSAGSGSIETVVTNGGTVSSRAGLFLPHGKLRVDAFGSADRQKAEVALAEGVDFLALSFVRGARDVLQARRWLDGRSSGRSVGLISKIERAEALDAIDEILRVSDGIMVARGDLGIEVPLERLALEQKRMVRRANVAGRFVIVATQMLLSMLDSPRPTRAESTDVANAVLDGADAVMLSEESAVGKYPIEAVQWLARIAEATEPAYDPRPLREERERSADGEAERSVAAAAVQLAENVGALAIVTPTHSGRTARSVAALRPSCPVLALSGSAAVRHQLTLVRGVTSRAAPEHSDLAGLSRAASRLVGALSLPGSGPVVLTAGYPVEGRPTNLVTLVEPAPPASARARRRSRRERPDPPPRPLPRG